MLKEGTSAPDFCLNGTDGSGDETEICLSNLLEQKKDVVLYFYPRDNTPG